MGRMSPREWCERGIRSVCYSLWHGVMAVAVIVGLDYALWAASFRKSEGVFVVVCAILDLFVATRVVHIVYGLRRRREEAVAQPWNREPSVSADGFKAIVAAKHARWRAAPMLARQIYNDGINILTVAPALEGTPRETLLVSGLFLVMVNLICKPATQVMRVVSTTDGGVRRPSCLQRVGLVLCGVVPAATEGLTFALHDDGPRFIWRSAYTYAFRLASPGSELNPALEPPRLPEIGDLRVRWIVRTHLLILFTACLLAWAISILVRKGRHAAPEAISAYVAVALLAPDLPLSVALLFVWFVGTCAGCGRPCGTAYYFQTLCCTRLCCVPDGSLDVRRTEMWRCCCCARVSMFRLVAYFWNPDEFPFGTLFFLLARDAFRTPDQDLSRGRSARRASSDLSASRDSVIL